MNTRFANKTALITGAAAGIGAATARLMAVQGAKILLADINSDAGQAVAEEIKAAGGSADFIACDVSDETQIMAAVKRAVAFGGRLDVMVNNAGIGGKPAPIHETDNVTWERVLRVNLTSVFWGQKHATLAMLADGKGGAIVNVASIAGIGAAANLNAYGATKAGVIQLTATGSSEVSRAGIRINAVCPGWTDTAIIADMDAATRARMVAAIPLGRLGEASEIAQLIAFLASDEASFISGVAYRIDGGLRN